MDSHASNLHSRWRELVFGFSGNLLSGFGQTYFISLFLLSFVNDLSISLGTFGILYSSATCVAAVCLPRFGAWLDRRGEFTAFTTAGFGLACALVFLSGAIAWWMLIPALFAMRLFGQGAMTLISATSIAKHFEHRRGVALGISNLGFPVSEMLLPSATLFALGVLSWRWTVGIYAVVLVVLLILVCVITRASDSRFPKKSELKNKPDTTSPTPEKSKFAWWKDPVFLAFTGSSMILPFGGTVTMLYLIPISQSKGWPADWVASGFILFAIVRAAASLLSGVVIDLFSGVRVFAWSVLPFCLAVAVLIVATSPWVGLGFFVLMGLGFGAGNAVTAIVAEVYDRRRLGEIRSLSSAAGVFATALGPVSAGLGINAGLSFQTILFWLLLTSIVALAIAFMVPHLVKIRQRQQRSPSTTA